MDIDVREATADDVEPVREVARDSWYAAYGSFIAPDAIDRGLEASYDPELLAAAVAHEAIAFSVAEVDAEVVGFASAERTWADEVELHTIYVHPDWWGEGVGSALLEAAISFALDEGVDRLVCAVFDDNVVGIGFLEARGFERGQAGRAIIGGEQLPEHEFELSLEDRR